MKVNKIKERTEQNRTLNAVAMKNEIQSKLYNQTKGLNNQELIEFYRKKAKDGPFGEKFYLQKKFNS
jgi:hypothetical protein